MEATFSFFGGSVKKVSSCIVVMVTAAVLWVPSVASAQSPAPDQARFEFLSAEIGRDQQSNVPQAAREAEDAVEEAVKRFRMGVEAGVGLDPELIMFGVHGSFAPIFHRGVSFRPGAEVGVGELTTLFGINLDVLYTLPGASRTARWTAYVGAGPNFSLSHRGFESEIDEDDRNRFDFSDTDFEPGFNFIAGARARNGMFVELKATAYGVSNVRMMVGYNF
jgi:hypothetical protein